MQKYLQILEDQDSDSSTRLLLNTDKEGGEHLYKNLNDNRFQSIKKMCFHFDKKNAV